MGKIIGLVGLVVVALFISGAAQGVFGVFQGTSTPRDIPARVGEQFQRVGLTVPGDGRYAEMPGEQVPGAGVLVPYPVGP